MCEREKGNGQEPSGAGCDFSPSLPLGAGGVRGPDGRAPAYAHAHCSLGARELQRRRRPARGEWGTSLRRGKEGLTEGEEKLQCLTAKSSNSVGRWEGRGGPASLTPHAPVRARRLSREGEGPGAGPAGGASASHRPESPVFLLSLTLLCLLPLRICWLVHMVFLSPLLDDGSCSPLLFSLSKHARKLGEPQLSFSEQKGS
ncbi:uncharacterized protein [Equus caballus]|uniref:uncharacterized protein n=1 Tax=Equus caballus TaxID=9796 RepID=UPI0038B2402E